MPVDYSLYTVVTTRLDTGEVVPMLVASSTWIPARLATRWVLLNRRRRSASKTLKNNLFTLKLVYCWARRMGLDLDEYLLAEGELKSDQIKSLVTELQAVRSARIRHELFTTSENGHSSRHAKIQRQISEAQVAVPIDADLCVIQNFLSWALDPINSGFKPDQSRVASFELLNSTRRSLRNVIHAYKLGTLPSCRPEPLSPEQLSSLHFLIDPLHTGRRVDASQAIFPRTPWTLKTCLRNWLMFCLAEQHGLRIGEILKLTIEDILSLTPAGPLTANIRRRPDDPRDTRTHPPAVKTLERVLELTGRLRWGFRLYLTARLPMGRVAGSSPYLFVTEAGNPMSYWSAREALLVLGKLAGVSGLTWHKLRHTWAESLARELFEQNGIEEQAIEKLRYLGGWSEKSLTPFHYIRNAIRESANQFLRKRNERMYQGPNSTLV